METQSLIKRDISNSASKIAQLSKTLTWWRSLKKWGTTTVFHQNSTSKRQQPLKLKVWKPVMEPQLPLISHPLKSTSLQAPLQVELHLPLPLVTLRHLMRISALKVSSMLSAKSGRMRWKELSHSDSMVTSEERSQEMIALSNQVMRKLREISSFSFMETL